jgi:hypothetical protein
MKIVIGDRFNDHLGRLCVVTYTRGHILKITFLCEKSWTDVWDKKEFMEQLELGKFVSQPKLSLTKLNLADHLIEFQLNLIGKTTEDCKGDDKWYNTYTLTSNQHKMFEAYAVYLIRKVLKYNRKRAKLTFSIFDLTFGLRTLN